MLEYLHASKKVGFEYDDLEKKADGTIGKGRGWNTLMLASLNQRYGEHGYCSMQFLNFA